MRATVNCKSHQINIVQIHSNQMIDFGGTTKYRSVPGNNRNTGNMRHLKENAHALEIFQSFDNN